ncbi:MAG: hypothetical protein ABSD59_17855 [Terracidiphilus sp.]
MGNSELSEDCKQRLRDLEHGIAQVIQCLTEKDYDQSTLLSGQLVPLIDQGSGPDEPCKEVLRGIEQTSTSLALIFRSNRVPAFEEEVVRLIDELEGSRRRIEAILLVDSEHA